MKIRLLKRIPAFILLFPALLYGCSFDEKEREKQKAAALKAKRNEVYKGWKTVKGSKVSFSLPTNITRRSLDCRRRS